LKVEFPIWIKEVEVTATAQTTPTSAASLMFQAFCVLTATANGTRASSTIAIAIGKSSA
jgi:hypothetical protein